MKKSKMLCHGCRHDWYNSSGLIDGGCWSFQDAKVVQRKFVPVDAVPPWDTQPVVETLDCHRENRFIAVRPDQAN